MASTPGLGSTVVLLLPACGDVQDDGPDAPPSPAAQARCATQAADAGHAGGHCGALLGAAVLLVEDNEALASVTGLLLESHGCTVRHARNAGDALAQLEADGGVDLVLSDVVMPGGQNGIDLAHELRRRQPRLPVVLISGYSAALNGLTDFPVLRKPVAAEQLVHTLVAALAGKATVG